MLPFNTTSSLTALLYTHTHTFLRSTENASTENSSCSRAFSVSAQFQQIHQAIEYQQRVNNRSCHTEMVTDNLSHALKIIVMDNNTNQPFTE